MLYGNTGIVPEQAYAVPFGKARVLAEGHDVTLVAISHMVVEALRAKHLLEEIGIAAEVIDPVSLAPLDTAAIAASVEKTGRLVVVDTSWLACGAGAEIVAATHERLEGKRAFSALRLGYEPTPCPTTRPLEEVFYPNAKSIATKVAALLKRAPGQWQDRPIYAREIAEFRGPF